MKSINLTLAFVFLTVFFITGLYVAKNYQLRPATAGPSGDLAAPAGDLLLCQRLTRFGQVAYERGQFAEAKHFFQKAIMVYPSNVAAWKKYNMALLSLISAKVETDPAFLPEPVPVAAPSPAKKQNLPAGGNEADGC